MSPDQIALVQQSFRDIVPIKDLAAKIFYERLFALDPGLKPLFRASLHEQGQKFMTALAAIVGGIYRLLDMGNTTLNVMGDMVGTSLVAQSEAGR